MKSLAIKISITLLLMCCNQNVQEGNMYIFDYENILNYEEEAQLNSLILAHEEKTTNQIAIVTTPNWGNEDNSLTYSVEFGNRIGVGQKDKDNGVIIVFSKTLREARISTGYGTEKVLKDEIAKKILDSLMFPNFRQEKYFKGLLDGTTAIIEFLERPENKIK